MRTRTLLAAALLFAATETRAAGPNVVTGVEVVERGAAAEVTIRSSKPPSFTTFSLVDPPRFVVDISEATFDGVTRKLPGAGAVKEVNSISFGEGVHATARVTVTFSRDVDAPEVTVTGGTLVIRVQPPPGTAVASAPPAAPPPVAAVAAAPAAVAAAPAAPPAVKAPAAPAPPAPATAAAAPATAVPATAATSDAAAAAAAAAAVEQARVQQEQKEAQERALAQEAKAREEAQARALADARAAAEARAAADAKAATEARAAAEAKARAAADARAAAEARAAADAKAAVAAKATADSRATATSVPPPGPAPAAAAAPAAPAPAARPAPPAGPNQVEAVGFRQTADGSRVFVRMRSTPRFSVSEPEERLVRVEFPNTGVPLRNDLNALDTSFFPTAVARVTPRRQGRTYVLDIQLREQVAWRQRIDGDTLTLEFDNPSRPATTPPAPAAPQAAPGK
jgi:hypothetical protein